MTTGPVRCGIISTAGITEALIPGLLAAPSAELTGIASRSKLLLHQGGEVYLDGEPKVEVFPFDDPYMREVEHFDGTIRGEHALAWDLADARANTVVLEATHESLRRRAPVPIGS